MIFVRGAMAPTLITSDLPVVGYPVYMKEQIKIIDQYLVSKTIETCFAMYVQQASIGTRQHLHNVHWLKYSC